MTPDPSVASVRRLSEAWMEDRNVKSLNVSMGDGDAEVDGVGEGDGGAQAKPDVWRLLCLVHCVT